MREPCKRLPLFALKLKIPFCFTQNGIFAMSILNHFCSLEFRTLLNNSTPKVQQKKHINK